MKLHYAIREGLGSAQAQRHIAMPRRDQWKTFPDERRHDGDDELVDRAGAANTDRFNKELKA
jgi:hypothetical protein